jgi:hypothetical protein
MLRRSSILRTIAGLVSVVSGLTTLYLLVIRPWHLRWGATADEAHRVLPGDDLVPQPKINATHAITIHAPIEQVWPWIVQIGYGRGGFYSYEFVENAMGLDIHNANRILPEHQSLNVGDVIPFAPSGFDVPVAIVEPPRVLVVHGDTRTGGSGAPKMRPGDYLSVAWSWHLEPIDGGTTRFVERWRLDFGPGLINTLAYRVFLEPGAFIMERKMLLGIKQRAEALAR